MSDTKTPTANDLTAEQKDSIRKDFDFFDRDQDGQIDLREFIDLLTILSPKTKINHVQEGFNIIDSNGDGHIDFEEFLAWWQEGWWEY
ncbi:EF-hand domain-containing protein [Glaciecola sp. XM2]|jgi:Ca2+-binding EF-hand superfamily protein|uniref:EF-hand domain-containing protein n=1 Tax=Glaciecola sp. XM2 TaxID=1914931 RepID=UPI001BDE0CC1|nr:EF-hand domain-containing protein [Glaciecola sp. XM2]MBT1451950.1 EF-hand domain-containing protein [Glaciecola sp. XM2]